MNKQDSFNPFNRSFGNAIGRGKDNVVVPFKGVEKVLKWNHKPKKETNTPEHFNRLLYKKKKYEMFQFFLNDFIPSSSFVLGHKSYTGKDKSVKLSTKQYTVQDRVPIITIASLSDEQKSDPRLLYNIHLLIMKIRAMSNIVKKVNNSIEKNGKLDTELDLGGLSKTIEQQAGGGDN